MNRLKRFVFPLLLLLFTPLSVNHCGVREKEKTDPLPEVAESQKESALRVAPWSGKAGGGWGEFDQLVDGEKFEEASKIAQKVLEDAQKSRDSEESVRALIRYTQLRMALHGYETAVKFLKDQPWPEDLLSTTVLNLFYAHALTHYADAYSWEIREREKVVSQKSVDLKSWTLDEILFEAGKAYQNVWQLRDSLGDLPVTLLAEYIEPNDYPPEIRPTLRDALSYMWAELLADSSNWRPEHANEIYLLDLNSLIQSSLETKEDSINDPAVHPIKKAASILEDLENWHAKRGEKEAALEAHLERLRHLHQHFSEGTDRKVIQNHLQGFLQDYQKFDWWAYGMATLAEFVQSGEKPNAQTVAWEIASKAYKAGLETIGGKKAFHLIRSIEEPHYELEGMASDAPKKQSIGIRYKNITRLYFRAYPVDLQKQVESADNYLFPRADQLENIINNTKPSHEWSVELPATTDFLIHRKFATPPMENHGAYMVASSAKEDFSGESNKIEAIPFVISDLVLLSHPIEQELKVTLVSGSAGAPVSGAEVLLYRYDWNVGHGVEQRKMSDPQGLAHFTHIQDYSHFLMAKKGDDIAIDPKSRYFYAREPDTESISTFIYTDRSIYRPLQKVYWKAVLYKGIKEKEDYRTLPSTEVALSLIDPNQETVETKTVVTNRFGSASGEFLIPSGRLLGEWTLRCLKGEASIRIEEYKRPTFEAKFLDSETPLRFNKPVTLQGEVRYYFGLPVTNGTAKWRVARREIYPLWWHYGWEKPRQAKSQFIASGISPLNEEGKFSLTFTPQADERKKSEDLSYLYTLTADVTDEGGETRSTTKTFRLGFKSVEVLVRMEMEFFTEKNPVEFTLVRTNLDGNPAPGEGKWRLVNLIQPEETLLPADLPLPPSPSEDPPLKLADDQKHSRWDASYQPGLVLRDWKDGEEKNHGELTHNEKGEAKLHLSPILAGAYRLHYETIDPFGETCQVSREFIVADPKIRLALPALLLVQKNSMSAGETARILVNTGLQDQIIFFDTYRDGKQIQRRLLDSDSETSLIEIPLTEKDRGGFSFSFSLVRDHQFIHLSESVFVPWDNKELKVEFSTFRDKLTPGQKEKWNVKISSPSEAATLRATTEILAYMYDRSLDIFAKHHPPAPITLFPYHASMPRLESSLGQAERLWVRSEGFEPLPGYPRLKDDRLKLSGPMKMVLFDHVRPLSAPLPEEEGAAALKLEEADIKKGKDEGDSKPPSEIPLRENFSETAFWQPHLLMGEDGSASIEFTVPDSVTSWNVWVHAVTNDLKSGSVNKITESVKDLMVRPYLPRFLREGDEATLKIVVNNASEQELKGGLVFDIIDPETNESLLNEFGITEANANKKSFISPAGGGTNLSFSITTPSRVGPVAFKVTAQSGDFSDGELRPLPILPGRIHLAQSRFVALKDAGKRVMKFSDLASGDDPSRINEQIVVTLDGQLFYSVLSALPYLVNYPYECTEQTLNRFLSTGILSSLYKDYPAISRMAGEFAKRQTQFETWGAQDPNRKMALEETPWLAMAKGGEKEIADLIKVLDPRIARAEQQQSLAKLQKAQNTSGAFPWFPGGPPSPFMTLYLLSGFSKALEFGVEIPKPMIVKGWAYLHQYYVDEVVGDMMKKDCCWEAVSFLNYTLSNYPDPSWTENTFSSDERSQMLDFSFKHWKDHSPYLKGFLALTLHRMNRPEDARIVWDSVMDAAKTENDQGTFWMPEDRSWLWYNDTIETHAFAIRTLMELSPEDPKLDGLVLWLFLNKKLNHWKSTKATAEAIYSLAHYLKKTKQLGLREEATVTAGDQKKTFVFEPDQYTGRKNQMIIAGEKIDPQTHSEITVEKTTKGYLLASSVWHFSTEKLPEEASGDFLRVTRRYFKRVKNPNGIILQPLEEGAVLMPGDEVEVHLSLTAKHPVGYVHLRDPRAAGFEPENAVSQYRWDLGIGWYEEIRDSSTNFFFEDIPQGEYNFKYRIRANMAGTFKIAPAAVQPMYAPEFTAYSSGAKITIR